MQRARLSAVRAEDFGFSSSGLFRRTTESSPNRPSARISCRLTFAFGSAISVTRVVCGPVPANAVVRAALAFSGNLEAASSGVPLKVDWHRNGIGEPSNAMPQPKGCPCPAR